MIECFCDRDASATTLFRYNNYILYGIQFILTEVVC